MKKAFKLQAQGRKLEASKYYTYHIKNGIKDSRVFSNYGIFLNEIGKPKEAELLDFFTCNPSTAKYLQK